MVKHIVMWTLNDEAKRDCEKITRFKSLLGVVDGLKAIEIGHNYNGGKYDLVLLCEFDSREAQEKYQTHPAHVAIKEIVHSLTCGRECADYKI